jgi:maleate isomerase
VPAKSVIGFISPSVAHIPNDIQLMLPPQAGVIVATLSNRNGLGEEERVLAAVETALGALVHEGAQAVILFGIPLAAKQGFAAERAAHERFSAAKGVPVVSSLFTVVESLKALGAPEVLAVTQYTDAVNGQIVRYAADAGVTIAGTAGLGAGNADQVNAIDIDDYGRIALDALPKYPKVKAILLAARGELRDVAMHVETQTGLPVVHQQAAALWWAFTKLGVSLPAGHGRLLSGVGAIA